MKQFQDGVDESNQHAPTGLMARLQPVLALNRFGLMDQQSPRERVDVRRREEPIRVVLSGSRIAPVLGL